MFDGEVGNAFAGIKLVRRDDRGGRADVDAGTASAAMVAGGLIHR